MPQRCGSSSAPSLRRGSNGVSLGTAPPRPMGPRPALRPACCWAFWPPILSATAPALPHLIGITQQVPAASHQGCLLFPLEPGPGTAPGQRCSANSVNPSVGTAQAQGRKTQHRLPTTTDRPNVRKDKCPRLPEKGGVLPRNTPPGVEGLQGMNGLVTHPIKSCSDLVSGQPGPGALNSQ